MTDELGRRVLELRRRKGLSQAKLAPLVPVSPAYLSLVEQGKRQPRAAVLRNLAARLGTTVEYLTTGRHSEPHNFELDLRFGEVALRNGDPSTARRRFAAAHAETVALGVGYAAEQYEALYGIARADWTLGRTHDAIAGFEALLDAHDLPSSVSRVALHTWLCRAYQHVGDMGRAIDFGEAALAEVGPLNRPGIADGDGTIELAATLAAAYQERGDLTRAQMLTDSVVLVAEAMGSMQARGAAYWTAATVAEARGDVRAAVTFADRAIALFGELGFAYEVAALRINLATYSLRQPDTDLDAAEAQLRESIAVLVEVVHGAADLAWGERELARCLLLAGRVDEAVNTARTALDRVPAAPLERGRSLAVLAAALLAIGSEDEALSAYQGAVAALEAFGAHRQAAPVWQELAGVVKAMGRDRDAITALERMGAALGVMPAPISPRPATAPH